MSTKALPWQESEYGNMLFCSPFISFLVLKEWTLALPSFQLTKLTTIKILSLLYASTTADCVEEVAICSGSNYTESTEAPPHKSPLAQTIRPETIFPPSLPPWCSRRLLNIEMLQRGREKSRFSSFHCPSFWLSPPTTTITVLSFEPNKPLLCCMCLSHFQEIWAPASLKL